jgi:hypothetical protein
VRHGKQARGRQPATRVAWVSIRVGDTGTRQHGQTIPESVLSHSREYRLGITRDERQRARLDLGGHSPSPACPRRSSRLHLLAARRGRSGRRAHRRPHRRGRRVPVPGPRLTPREAACGVSPAEASSAKTIRHRLNRGGDRQANNALWVIALTRLRIDPPSASTPSGGPPHPTAPGARREGFEPPTARSVAWWSTSDWSAPVGSDLLRLDASSIQTDREGTRRIVRIKQNKQLDEPRWVAVGASEGLGDLLASPAAPSIPLLTTRRVRVRKNGAHG